ncbi:hypothetical protein [Leptolyngbya sp. NIES-2104]|uniref:hypothetical protein n=1 Tax=Leptolyngbya sp. NIES-2104 TaxID=1552121 RepID=UPI000AF9B491|nr:hypothetical protein [Leptolyngbya sp. NIES-2104]
MSKQISLLLAVLVCLPLGLIAAKKLQARTPGVVSGCPEWAFTQTANPANVIHPEKIVVEPWQGRHNVFATFKVPEGYEASEVVVVTVQGSHSYCGIVMPHSPSGMTIDQRVFGWFRTRTALWLLTRGQLSQLEKPENWKLAIFKPSERVKHHRPDML